MKRMPAVPALSIVIPTLNEEASLPGLLDELRAQTLEIEIVVADGGSLDGTCSEVERRGIRLVRAERGRAAQMNAGAQASGGRHLLFLHADSRLESSEMLASALAAFDTVRQHNTEMLAGHFALRFARTRSGSDAQFRFMEAKTRSGRRGTINGDQGFLMTRTTFDVLGGFDASLPFLEDQRLAEKIFQTGRWMLLPGELSTSARRFESEGHRRRYALMGLMMAMHEAGLEEFFRQAPQVYAGQDSASALRLKPFLDLARTLFIRQLKQDPALLLRAGRYVRGNAWQLALMLDVARDDGVWVERFDRWIAPRLDHSIADALAACLATGLAFGLAPQLERLASSWATRGNSSPQRTA